MTTKHMKELAHLLLDIHKELLEDDDRYLIYQVRGHLDVATKDLEDLSRENCD